MRRACLAIFALTAASDVSLAADCTCRSQGRDYELGKSVCLQTPKGARMATCGMVLNNTSWQFSDTPCVISQAPDGTPVRHEQASQQTRHGG
jgi:hypothetical protein